MKRRFLTFVLIMISMHIFSQELFNDSTYYYTGAGWIGWMPNAKEFVLSRNDQGQVLELVRYEKTPSTDWAEASRILYTYYPDEITVATKRVYVWDENDSQWLESEYYAYNQNGLNTQTKTQEWNMSSDIVVSGEKYIRSYSGDIQLEQVRRDTFHDQLEEWVPVQLHLYSYVDGKLSDIIVQNGNGSVWNNYSKTYYNYAGLENPVQIFNYLYDDETEDWVNNTRYTFNHNDEGEILYVIFQHWDELQFVIDWRNDFTYINDTIIETQIFQTHNGTDYVNQYKKNYVYTETDKTDYILLESPVATDEWENDEITRYEYNIDDLMTSRTTEYWESSDWQDSLIYDRIYDEFGNMIREEQMYYEGSEMADWYHDYAVDYFWVEETLTGLIERENVEISYFPNPTQDYLNVLYNGRHNYTIYDLKGNIVNSGQFVSAVRISLVDLNNGVYIISLDNGKSVKRILKEK